MATHNTPPPAHAGPTATPDSVGGGGKTSPPPPGGSWNFTARGKYAADVLYALRDQERAADSGTYPSQLAGSVAVALETFAANATSIAPEGMLWEVQTSGQVGQTYTVTINLVADPNYVAPAKAAPAPATPAPHDEPHAGKK